MADRARQLRYEWFLREFPHRQSVLRLAARTGLRADGGADSSGRRTGVSPRLSRAPAPGRRVHPERNLHKGVFPLERHRLAMAAAHVGFIVLFYTVGSAHGVWGPQELNYTNSVSTAFPWVSGVPVG